MPEATWKPREKHGRLTTQSDLPDSVYAFEVPNRKGGTGVRDTRCENSSVRGRGRPRWQTGDPDQPQAATREGGRSSSRRGGGWYREGLAGGLTLFCEQRTGKENRK
jgi:hypothetical protein